MSDGLFLDIRSIRVAHEYTLDRVRKCAYPHGRGTYGLVMGLEGRAEFRFSGGERVTLEAGEWMLISPSAAYAIANEEAFRHYTINFELHEESSSPLSALVAPGRPPCRTTDAAEHALRRLVGIWGQKRAGYEMEAVGCLYEVFFHLFAEDSRREGAVGHRLAPAREHIEKYFDRPITLSELAYLADMSETHLRREWKKHFSESPLQYRDRLRLAHAKELLLTGYYTVSEIAEKCGFEDVSYFVRFFRKKTGTSPGEFKKNNAW